MGLISSGVREGIEQIELCHGGADYTGLCRFLLQTLSDRQILHGSLLGLHSRQTVIQLVIKRGSVEFYREREHVYRLPEN